MSLTTYQAGAVDSTNSEALRRLEGGQAVLPFLLIGDSQTGGRGRGGKAWSSPPGNFYGTFALAADREDATMAQVSFVAALALAKALEELGLDPQLKWPNDILLKGAKVSGILLEKHGAVLLIGMGINITSHPNVAGYPSTCLAEEGVQVRAQDLGHSLSKHFLQTREAWQQDGFVAIREGWLARAYGLNQPLTARLADRVLEGQFAGLGADGALQLATATGTAAIHAGEVYFHAAGH